MLAPTHPRADVTRYVWDARAVRAGLSPYAVIPADPATAHLRTPESWPVNNPDVPSPYPPGAQLFFLLATVPAESALAVKAALVLCEVLLALALWRWLLAIAAAPGWILAYLGTRSSRSRSRVRGTSTRSARSSSSWRPSRSRGVARSAAASPSRSRWR